MNVKKKTKWNDVFIAFQLPVSSCLESKTNVVFKFKLFIVLCFSLYVVFFALGYVVFVFSDYNFYIPKHIKCLKSRA